MQKQRASFTNTIHLELNRHLGSVHCQMTVWHEVSLHFSQQVRSSSVGNLMKSSVFGKQMQRDFSHNFDHHGYVRRAHWHCCLSRSSVSIRPTHRSRPDVNRTRFELFGDLMNPSSSHSQFIGHFRISFYPFVTGHISRAFSSRDASWPR